MQPRRSVFDAIGTHWQIDCACAISDDEWSSILSEIHERIDLFDQTYSRFRPDSLVMQLAADGGTREFPGDAQELFDVYTSLYALTDGAFTPLIGNMLSDAGYDATYSLVERELRPVPLWEDVLKYTHPYVSLQKGHILDFGAGGKGYLVDIVSNILRARGIPSFCVDAGGDIVMRSTENKPMMVGLEHPLDTTLAIGVVPVCNQSITGSAGNRRKWGKYHHIFDPRTSDSTHEVLATWVIAPTGLLADSLATCLFVVEPEKLSSFQFEYLLMYPDLTVEHSPGFQVQLFTTESK